MGTPYFGAALALPTTAQHLTSGKTNQLCNEAAPKELPSPFSPLFFHHLSFPPCSAHIRVQWHPITDGMQNSLSSCPAPNGRKTHHSSVFFARP